MSDTVYWGVVRTRPRQEHRADENLRRQGYETLLPIREVTLRQARRLVTRRVPLFPSYLFVRLGAASCRGISSTRGVSQLVAGDGGRPRRVGDAVISEIRANCDADGLFASAIAEVASAPSPDRLWVFLDIMDRCVSVEVSKKDVTRIS